MKKIKDAHIRPIILDKTGLLAHDRSSDVENSNFLKIKKQRNTQRVLCFHILEKEKIQILL